MLQGLTYEDDTDGMVFIPGVFVEDMFYATPIPLFDLGKWEMVTHEYYKKYFDFWFAEFVPYVPSSVSLTPEQKTAEALSHWLPPYNMLNEALSDIAIVFSPEEAEDFAAIVRSDFTIDGLTMTKEEALSIYNSVKDAIQDLADKFFIAGVDYNEDYSNPAKPAYIASFFAREDKILSDGGDIGSNGNGSLNALTDSTKSWTTNQWGGFKLKDNEGEVFVITANSATKLTVSGTPADGPYIIYPWEKLYSATEGLGRINRNLEGIPTATFWELDFTGSTRSIVHYTLDDGTPVYLRVPEEWWNNYTVTTLGNDRTDPDTKKLQYVGNVESPDEVVGQRRDVAQLLYTQEWSYLEDGPEPVAPSPGDKWTTEDYDSIPARWVVSYLATPDENWTDDMTSYSQYSIYDGREYNSIDIPYVDSIYTGPLLIEAMPFMSMVSAMGASSVFTELGGGFFSDILMSEGFSSLFVTVDNSVKVPWDRKDWDLGDAGDVLSYHGIGLMDGLLIYEEQVGNIKSYYLTLDSESLQWKIPIDPGAIGVFTGNNWDFGTDANERLVFGQMNIGNDELHVSQNGVTLTEINNSDRYISSQGRQRTWLGTDYYVTYLTYDWNGANNLANNWGDGWHLAVINDAAENELVRTLAGGQDVWLGGYDINGYSSYWSMDWVYGSSIDKYSGYSNFAYGEPNNWNGIDEDHLMMWSNGLWNDVDGASVRKAVFEREPRWNPAPPALGAVTGETQDDYVYKMTTEWEDVLDIRSNITYRIFTGAHDIVDLRPRYETIASNVPVIKMEQVTNWEYVPVLEQQLSWSSSAVPADGPLDLSIFDLDTLSASGNITITAGDNVIVKASMNAAGDTSEITIGSTGGDVTVGGDVIIGETATLITGNKTSVVPLSTVFGDDVDINAGGQVLINGAIDARDNVSVSAG